MTLLAIIHIYGQVYMSLGVCVCIHMCTYEYVYAYVCVMCIYVHPPADFNAESAVTFLNLVDNRK